MIAPNNNEVTPQDINELDDTLTTTHVPNTRDVQYHVIDVLSHLQYPVF